MVLDGHTHMFQERHILGELKKRIEEVNVDFTQLFERMTKLGIEKMVTLCEDESRINQTIIGSNELAVDLQQQYPEKIIAILGLEPMDRKDVFNKKKLDEFETLVKKHEGVKGVLLTPPFGHFKSNDRRAYPFYEKAVELDIAVYFHHTGGWGGAYGKWTGVHWAPLRYAQLEDLDDVVIDFPDLRINVEHLGKPSSEKLFALMNHAPNVYADITWALGHPTTTAWHLVMAKECHVIDRIFWGTDTVWNDIDMYMKFAKMGINYVQNDLNSILKKCGWPTLTQEEIEGILNQNVRKLLKI